MGTVTPPPWGARGAAAPPLLRWLVPWAGSAACGLGRSAPTLRACVFVTATAVRFVPRRSLSCHRHGLRRAVGRPPRAAATAGHGGGVGGERSHPLDACPTSAPSR